MQRKVIQISENTLVCTLPTEYIRQWKIHRGDILEMSIQEQSLIISCKKTPLESELVVENYSLKDIELWYSLGFDKVQILGKHPSLICESLCYDNILVEENKVILSISSEVKPEELEPIMRRIFYLCRQFPLDKISALIYQNVRICARILAKYGYKHRAGTFALLRLLWEIEQCLPHHQALDAINRIPAILKGLEQSLPFVNP